MDWRSLMDFGGACFIVALILWIIGYVTASLQLLVVGPGSKTTPATEEATLPLRRSASEEAAPLLTNATILLRITRSTTKVEPSTTPNQDPAQFDSSMTHAGNGTPLMSSTTNSSSPLFRLGSSVCKEDVETNSKICLLKNQPHVLVAGTSSMTQGPTVLHQ
jgi:hypothetical protein